MDETISSLSRIELKIIPFLGKSIEEIITLSGLDRTTVLRAMKFLENKKILEMKLEKRKIVSLGVNGIYYKKNHLPERRLLHLVESRNHIPLKEAEKESGLSSNEFKVSLGVLKRKGFIELKNGKISLSAPKEEIIKKFPEESLIEILPIEESKLDSGQKKAMESLKNRKEILELTDEKIISYELTPKGKELAGKEIKSDLLEEVTPEMIKTGIKGKKFRKYDILAPVPRIYGGKKHFVNQSIEYAKKIWLELGFEEMSGPLTDSSFWIFDALFTAQDHPAREMQDSFFIKNMKSKLPDKKIVSRVKTAHEKGIDGSEGWQYLWSEKEAEKILLRTHTTSLSARTLAGLDLKKLPVKFFSIGKVFRNETIDWSHGIEFYQSEGIVVDEKANFSHLLGYLKEFYRKMGYEKIRFRPSFFAYTEPSVEIEAYHPERKIWFELGGAGIFRPEVVSPLLGKAIPVLAWGQGFDRIIMDFYKIKDLRELYSNNIKKLREIRAWTK